MDEYKVFDVPGKGKRYMKNNRLIKKTDVPEDELEKLEKLEKESVIEQPPTDQPEQDPKACIFCGVHSRYTRFVDMRTVYLCDEHYYAMNMGKVAQKLRSTL